MAIFASAKRWLPIKFDAKLMQLSGLKLLKHSAQLELATSKSVGLKVGWKKVGKIGWKSVEKVRPIGGQRPSVPAQMYHYLISAFRG